MFSLDTFNKWLSKNGFTILDKDVTALGVKHTVAECYFGELPRLHKIRVIVGENGNAKIIKPNGTAKWYYQKTNGQLTATINTIKKFYK